MSRVVSSKGSRLNTYATLSRRIYLFVRVRSSKLLRKEPMDVAKNGR